MVPCIYALTHNVGIVQELFDEAQTPTNGHPARHKYPATYFVTDERTKRLSGVVYFISLLLGTVLDSISVTSTAKYIR